VDLSDFQQNLEAVKPVPLQRSTKKTCFLPIYQGTPGLPATGANYIPQGAKNYSGKEYRFVSENIRKK
jgi:hypothetical protein